MQEVKKEYQIVVVGGGINGAGIAREASAQGYNTLLVEKNDFAHATSSQSSKLIHGGIRYLEQGDFALVRESLRERKILLETAPHLVKPLRLNIPIYQGDKRPPWMVWIGCKLYDIFAGRKNMEPSRILKSNEYFSFPNIQDKLKGIVQYSDGQVLDSRLVLETALSAESYGATLKNYTELTGVEKKEDYYELTLHDQQTDTTSTIKTQYLINAAGPWVPGVDKLVVKQENRPTLKFVRGIHFVIPAITQGQGFLTLPSDGRVVFVLPWLDKYTLIGTTESDYEGNQFDKVPMSDEEIEYLLETFNGFFPKHNITMKDVLYTYSGVRTLISSGEGNLSKISREYLLESTIEPNRRGYIAVYGGKLTTYRSLATSVIEKIKPHLFPASNRTCDTAITPLFGGFQVSPQERNRWVSRLEEVGVAKEIYERWESFYGSQWTWIADIAVKNKKNRSVVGPEFFLFAELLYLVEIEHAKEAEDILTRRTKIIYEITEDEKQKLTKALNEIKAKS